MILKKRANRHKDILESIGIFSFASENLAIEDGKRKKGRMFTFCVNLIISLFTRLRQIPLMRGTVEFRAFLFV